MNCCVIATSYSPAFTDKLLNCLVVRHGPSILNVQSGASQVAQPGSNSTRDRRDLIAVQGLGRLAGRVPIADLIRKDDCAQTTPENADRDGTSVPTMLTSFLIRVSSVLIRG